MKMKVVAGILCTAVVLGGVLAFFLTRSPEKDVTVGKAEIKDIMKSIDVTGEVAPEQTFAAISATGGTVKQVNFKVGDAVEAGDTLFTLDASDLEKMLADAKQSLAEMQKGAQPVFNMQGGNLDALQKAKVALALAQTTGYDLDSLNNDIGNADLSGMKDVFAQIQGLDSQNTTALAEQAKLAADAQQKVTELEAQLQKYQLKSTVKGTVLQCNIKEGDTLLPGSPAMIVGNTDRLLIKAAVNEKDLQSISTGQTAMILNDATNILWQGTVESVPAMATRIEGLTGSETIGEVTIQPQEGFSALPGMTVGVNIVLDEAQSVCAVPIESIVYENEGAYVYVVSEGKAIKKKITTGLSDSFYTQVTQGMNEGDIVVMSPEKTLADGDRVRAVD